MLDNVSKNHLLTLDMACRNRRLMELSIYYTVLAHWKNRIWLPLQAETPYVSVSSYWLHQKTQKHQLPSLYIFSPWILSANWHWCYLLTFSSPLRNKNLNAKLPSLLRWSSMKVAVTEESDKPPPGLLALWYKHTERQLNTWELRLCRHDLLSVLNS